MTISIISTFAISAILSYIGVRAFIAWSRGRSILDVPNERSSHTTPTPRGGGIVFVAVSLISYLTLGLAASFRISWGYFAGALLIASISWVDDVFSISSGLRFLAHAAAATLFVLDIANASVFAGLPSEWILPAAAVSVLWLIWLTNAFNFMDGIDGIAASQAVVACLGWSAISCLAGKSTFSIYPMAVSGSVFGFLILNWQPAKVFMGDVGSAFLGFSLAAIPFLVAREGEGNLLILVAFAVLLVWFFLFDSLFTLFRRLMRGEKVWQAHRQHIYQRLVIAGLSHARVSLGFALFALVGTVEGGAMAAGLLSGWLIPIFTVIVLSAILLILVRKVSLT